MNWPEGSIVLLRSGGPQMTVDGTCQKPGIVPVAWFDQDKNIHRDVFAAGSLILVGLAAPS